MAFCLPCLIHPIRECASCGAKYCDTHYIGEHPYAKYAQCPKEKEWENPSYRRMPTHKWINLEKPGKPT